MGAGRATLSGSLFGDSKRPQAESAAAATIGGAQAAGDRGTTGRASVDLIGPVNEAGSVLYRFIASAEGGSSFIDTVDNERYFIAPSLSYLGLDGRLQVDLDLSYLRNDESFLFGIPSRNDRPDTRIGYDRFLGAADGSKLTEDYTAELRAEYALDERTQLDAALTYHLNEHDSRALRPFGPPGQQVAEDDTVRRSYSLRVFETDDLQFETNVVHEFFTDTTEWRFLAGGDVRRTTVAHAGPGFGNIVDFDRVDVLDPDNAAALPALDDPRIRFFDRSKQATDAYGAYVQAEVWLHDTWKLLAGLRYSDVDYTFKDTAPFLFNEQADKFSPRFGVLYKATPWTSLYASYSTSFEQALSFAPEDPGDPTEASQIEAGIKQEFFGGRLFATLSGFRIVQENLLQPDPNDPFRSIQIGEARTQGLELEINGELVPGLNLIAGYALLDNEISRATDGTEGNRLPNVARHEASLWLTYDLFRNSREALTLGAGVFAESSRFTSTQNRTRMPGYATADLMAQYRFTANDTELQLRAGVKNLFDREYHVGGFGEGISFRCEPRTVYVQLDARF